MARSEGDASSDGGEHNDPTVPLLQRSPSFTLGHRKSGDGHTISGDGFEGSIQAHLDALGALEQGQLPRSALSKTGGAAPDLEGEPEGGWTMQQLIARKPEDVIQHLEEHGLALLGEFDVTDMFTLKAFGRDSILTTGSNLRDAAWEAMWHERLQDEAQGEARVKHGWASTVTVQAHVVDIKDAAAPGGRGVLRPLLRKYQARGCSATVFALPAVQAIIHYKWTTWARRYLVYELGAYLVWLVAFATFTALFTKEDPQLSIWQVVATGHGFVAVVANLVSAAVMVPFLYMELCTLSVYGLRGWIGFWNMLDMASYVLQAAILTAHIGRWGAGAGWMSVAVALENMLMWTKLHYYARVFNPTRNLFIDTIRIVMGDIKWFLLFLWLTMMGFAFAFYALYREDGGAFVDYSSLWHSFAAIFAFMLGMFDYSNFYGARHPVAAMLFFMVFQLLVTILLLNILIAVMTNAFAKVGEEEGVRFLMSKAATIDELESTLPGWARRRPQWYPPYVHLLTVSPDSSYEPNLYTLWTGMGSLETSLTAAQQETKDVMEELHDSIARLNRKVDFMARMLITTAPLPAPPASAWHHPALAPAPTLSPSGATARPPWTTGPDHPAGLGHNVSTRAMGDGPIGGHQDLSTQSWQVFLSRHEPRHRSGELHSPTPRDSSLLSDEEAWRLRTLPV